MNTTQHWNAVYTRANCEKKVSRLLEKKGIVHYCPENQVVVNYLNKKRVISSVLFPSVIFVQAPDDRQLASMVRLPNVINLVYWRRQPAVFPAREIDLLRNFLETHETVQAVKTNLHLPNAVPVQESANHHYFSKDQVYTIQLPSIGYCLSAKTESVTSVKLVGKNASWYRTTEGLAFILGIKNNSSKFQ